MGNIVQFPGSGAATALAILKEIRTHSGSGAAADVAMEMIVAATGIIARERWPERAKYVLALAGATLHAGVLHSDPANRSRSRIESLLRIISEFGRMPRDPAHGRPYVCRVLPEPEEHQRREGRRQPFLDRISYPAALLVAVVLGFEGALVALSASEAEKAKQGPPAALRVEMAKPPQCSIETPDQLLFL